MIKKLLFSILLLGGVAHAQLFKHPFKSAKSDGADATLVRPSDWNAFQIPAPDTSVFISEEFLEGCASTATTRTCGTLNWSTSNSGTGTAIIQTAAVAGHPGIQNMSTGSTANRAQRIHLGISNTIGILNPVDNFTIVWIMRLNQSDANTVCRIGLANNANVIQPANGIYFEKLGADNNWFGVTRATSSQTRTAAMDATGTGWVRLTIRRVNGTTIGFQINNGTEITATATIPTAALIPWAIIDNNSTAAAKTIDLDYFHLLVTTIQR